MTTMKPLCISVSTSTFKYALSDNVSKAGAETSKALSNSKIDTKTDVTPIKVSAAQTSILCNFFEENPEVIRGYKRTPKCMNAVQNKWKKITRYLNAVGPSRDHKSWAKYICDMKAKLKRKRIKWRQCSDGKGPIMCNSDDFNEIRLRMLQVLRKDVTNLRDSEDSQISHLDAEEDNNNDYDEDHNGKESHKLEIVFEEIPDVKPKLEILEHNNDTPQDLQPPQLIFDDEFDYFGKNVAEQLRNLPLLVALETQEMLLSVLKNQQLKVQNDSFSNLDPLSKS